MCNTAEGKNASRSRNGSRSCFVFSLEKYLVRKHSEKTIDIYIALLQTKTK